MAVVYLSVGANVGDPVANVRFGLEALCAEPDILLTGISKCYRTAPTDYLDQDWFFNLAVRIETQKEPVALLDFLQEVQERCGQFAKAVRFGPRLLDLDILLYETRCIESKRLVLPHPRMAKRRFVLRPLCDIDPMIFHPISGQTVADLLALLPEDEQPMEEVACALGF